jgi:hypothetical protein
VKGNDCAFRSGEATCETDGRFSLPVCIESQDNVVVAGIDVEFQNATYVEMHKADIGTKIAEVLCDNIKEDIKNCQFVSMERLGRRRRRDSDVNRRLLFSSTWRTNIDIVFPGDANPDVLDDVLTSDTGTTSFQNILEEELTSSFDDIGVVSVSSVGVIQREDPDDSARQMMIIIISVGVAVFSLLCVCLMFCFGCGLYHGMKKNSNAPINTVIPHTVTVVQDADITYPTATTVVGEAVNSSSNTETPVIEMKTGTQYRSRKVSRPLMEFIKKARRSFVTHGQNESSKKTKDAWL